MRMHTLLSGIRDTARELRNEAVARTENGATRAILAVLPYHDYVICLNAAPSKGNPSPWIPETSEMTYPNRASAWRCSQDRVCDRARAAAWHSPDNLHFYLSRALDRAVTASNQQAWPPMIQKLGFVNRSDSRPSAPDPLLLFCLILHYLSFPDRLQSVSNTLAIPARNHKPRNCERNVFEDKLPRERQYGKVRIKH